MAIIAIFCDGTWKQFDSRERSHVALLADACAEDAAQKVLYFPGVGTGTGMVSRIGQWLSKVGGGLFGWGLNRSILSAYAALCEVYQPGDKIMVFGFSRGAYTARSLVGLIRKAGILAEPTEDNLRRAFQLYRLRGPYNGPDAAHIRAARRALSPRYATSALDVLDRADDSALVRISYLGVWDTVGALGIPRSILGRVATLWNRRHAFHDTRLTHLVEEARHAVALDEKRALFEPSLWDNLDLSARGAGLNRGDTSPQRPYQQVWFAGNHSVVGGSSGPAPLAAAPLAWIWAGARAAGLRLKPGRKIPEVVVDMAAPAPALYEVSALYRPFPWLMRWRHGPQAAHELHPTVRLRLALLPRYRPGSLSAPQADGFRKR